MLLPDDATRLRNLDNRLLVMAVFALLVAVFAAGEVLSPVPYLDPRFVVAYYTTEVTAAFVLLVVTALLFPARWLGLRLPDWSGLSRAWPALVLLAAALSAWLVTRSTLPGTGVQDGAAPWLVLRTTLVVGVNEEWIFRGLMLAALCRWWGLRRGALAAMALFGAFHLLNVFGGVPLWKALIQTCLAGIAGAIFVVAALATRSLLVPMVIHGLYDFAVIDAARLAAAGADSTPALFVPLVSISLGIWCTLRIWRMAEAPPYGD